MLEILSRRGIDENLRFLILEVSKQIERTNRYLDNPSASLLDSILKRDDYIDHLKNLIQRVCFEQVAAAEDGTDATVDVLKNVEIVAANLERIADFCENIVRQTSYISDEEILAQFSLTRYFNEVYAGLSLTADAVFNLDTNLALRICRSEDNLDQLYRDDLQSIIDMLETGSDARSLVTCLFISHYLERMGDSLLNIGEAILSAKLGERIKIGQLRSLEESLSAFDTQSSLAGIALKRIADTRSGTRIDRVTRHGDDTEDERMLVFKEGQRLKLLEERDGIARWDEVVPGLVPEVYAFSERGDTGALLFEFLPGETFERIVLGDNAATLARALERLLETLTVIWTKTRQNSDTSAGFVDQIMERIGDVYALHPEFCEAASTIGPMQITPFDALLERAKIIEEQLHAPFSVLIHGDFNIDNVIYDTEDDRIRFVDLHRSERQDYVQDISVFLVSNHRLQVFDTPIRARIAEVIRAFFSFSCAYAESVGDKTFQARLALGLARSFATSARFVLDDNAARLMFLRSRYLLEQLAAFEDDRFAAFRIGEEVLLD